MKRGDPGLPSGKLGKGFTVVNVGDDGEIADMRLVKHTENLLTSLPVRPRCG